MPGILFHLLVIFILASAAGVVLSRNTVTSALCLLLCLVGVSGVFVQLDAFLLAALLVFVYAGAVVALFLFIIMLLGMQGGDRQPFKRTTLVSGALAFLLLAGGVLSFASRAHLPVSSAAVAAPLAANPPGASLQEYAELLFTTYLLPVEIVGFLLLIAMLGVIVLSKKNLEAKDQP